jgi:hypothetical protein
MFALYSIDERRQAVAVQGERVPGGFILIIGLDDLVTVGRHHHNADECPDETLGGHIVRVPCSLDEVLTWFS